MLISPAKWLPKAAVFRRRAMGLTAYDTYGIRFGQQLQQQQQQLCNGKLVAWRGFCGSAMRSQTNPVEKYDQEWEETTEPCRNVKEDSSGQVSCPNKESESMAVDNEDDALLIQKEGNASNLAILQLEGKADIGSRREYRRTADHLYRPGSPREHHRPRPPVGARSARPEGAKFKFSDFNIRKAVLNSFRLKYKQAHMPTSVQSALLSALQHQHSFIGVSPAGTGKSLALAMHLLSEPRFRTPLPSITSLVLVRTPELGFQYMENFISLLRSGNAPVTTPDIVQFLYRGGPEDHRMQQTLLAECGAPHILIATPARLLDMLADENESRLLNLSFVRTVVLDEAESQLHPEDHRDEFSGLRKQKRKGPNKKRKQHISPAYQALDYLVRMRDAALNTYSLDVPLQVVALSSSTKLGDYLYQFLTRTEWMKGTSVKTYGVPGYSHLPVNTPHVEVSCVAYYPNVALIHDVDFSSAWRPEMIPHIGNANDKAAANVQHVELTQSITPDHLLAIKDVWERDSVKKGLLIIPSNASRFKVVRALRDIGITACPLNYSGGTLIADHEPDGYGIINMEKIFTNLEDPTVTPDLIVATPTQIEGLNFPGLSRIFVAGVRCLDHIPDPAKLFLRTRVSDAHFVEQTAFTDMMDKEFLQPSTNGNQQQQKKEREHAAAKTIFVTAFNDLFPNEFAAYRKWFRESSIRLTRLYPQGPKKIGK
ncbi:hypothetical protein V1525DRAFT_28808 [Lipomyces kononenkoae]|uniref:Uncharacterized protein n=1 Tax=Lipomyces kononenkoae TaxID=34357 RepID=A0ACC3T6M5_LIPKO